MSTPKLFYNQNDASKHAGVQLIEFPKDTAQLKVSSKGLKVLKGLPSNKSCNLCFIFGNARSGKSFMMNCLSGVRGLFQVVNSSTPCTQGVHISTHITPHEKILKHVKTYHDVDQDYVEELQKEQEGKATSGPPLCAFIDVEGQGDQDSNYDTYLALPMLLTSKVVLFNHKGAPTVTHMLEQLGVLARAGELIDLSDEKDEGSDEDSDEDENEEDGPKKFGHLHVLFRDFNFDGDEDSVYEMLMGKEKIPKKKGKKKKIGQHDIGRAIKERNDIRQLLLNNFESINVWLFNQPAEPNELQMYQELPEENVDEEFQKTAKNLLASITEQMTAPTKFNGMNISGPRLGSIICQVCMVLNKGGMVNIPSVFRSMEKERILRQLEESKKHFCLILKQEEDKLPYYKTEKDIDTHLADKAKKELDLYDTELVDCILLDELKASRKKLQFFMDLKVVEIKEKNKEKTIQRVQEVLNELSTRLKEEFQKYFDEHSPLENSTMLADKFGELKKESKRDVVKMLGVLTEALQWPKCTRMSLEIDESNQAYLMFLTTKNDTALKDVRIKQIGKQTHEQKVKLDEQARKLQAIRDEEKQKKEDIEKEIERIQEETKEEDRLAREAEEEFERQKQAIIDLKASGACCSVS